ncbi:cytochrome c5 [Flavobacterium arsenatis]|uniref:Cytochrome c5 n=1 Tax=Flavobacterium arsenatis TaxID=1484332 RepID=A0ABU1TNL3_9FLAO|nr:hypothetical protein [Flavobacterium arsenatis]MDR6967562.1 cytochrome c5 [Flavobacterium arsenatis]
MKSKIFIIALATIFISSCKTKKATTEKEIPVKEELTEVVTVVEEKPIAVLSPVAENPETIKLASTYDGASLYKNNCANCHQLYNAEEFSKEDWVPIMKKMQKKARITDAETLAIFNYLANQIN